MVQYSLNVVSILRKDPQGLHRHQVPRSERVQVQYLIEEIRRIS